MQKIILAVEDDKIIQKAWEFLSRGRVTLLQAFCLVEADQLLGQNKEFDLVIMDGCVVTRRDEFPPQKPTTQGLIKKIREKFQGPMIAASSDKGFRDLLMGAGCDYQCEKSDALKLAFDLLGLEQY